MMRRVESDCALSSVVEHYLHTVGVAGSKPAARTIPFLGIPQNTLVLLRNSAFPGQGLVSNPNPNPGTARHG